MNKLMQDNRFKCCEKCLPHETVCPECEAINEGYNQAMQPDSDEDKPDWLSVGMAIYRPDKYRDNDVTKSG